MIQRELLDPYEYIEIWLADAGLRGTPQYTQRYEQWLAYFDDLQIEAVGMGWITMVKSGSTAPNLIYEHWPFPVHQDVGDDLMAHLSAMKYAHLSDQQILDQTWCLADRTIQETTGLPGHEDPSSIILRRTDGLARAHEVTTALGGVLGACDGELSLGKIIDAVANLLEMSYSDLVQELLPELRVLISQTWLTPNLEISHF